MLKKLLLAGAMSLAVTGAASACDFENTRSGEIAVRRL